MEAGARRLSGEAVMKTEKWAWRWLDADGPPKTTGEYLVALANERSATLVVGRRRLEREYVYGSVRRGGRGLGAAAGLPDAAEEESQAMRSAMDPYKTLGVSKGASAATIKRSYRKKAMAAHPDRGGDEKAFGEVRRAFAVLSDPEKRAYYDRTGEMPSDCAGQRHGARRRRGGLCYVFGPLLRFAAGRAACYGMPPFHPIAPAPTLPRSNNG